MKALLLICSTLMLVACGRETATKDSPPPTEATPAPVEEETTTSSAPPSLDEILASQSDELKQRYQYRHPKETLEFFGIEPGMKVLEALPGGGWYSKILLPYLGNEGTLIGIDYDYSMWPNFSFVNDEFLAKRKTWAEEWPTDAAAWGGEQSASVSAYTFATLPAELSESVDAALFIRALHNLNRFEDKGQFLTKALSETHRVLKPGGIVGVVQHQASEEKPDEWADGSRGYLKKSYLVEKFEKAGFSLVKESTINENPKDQPGEEDIVWRLPPVYTTSKDDEALKAKYTEIGESNRMTLLFQKVTG